MNLTSDVVRRAICLALFGLLAAGTVAAQSNTAGPRERITSHEVTVIANVRGAQVSVDGVRATQTSPATFTLRPGTYTLRVEARGYLTWEERIVVAGARVIRVTLLPPKATLILDIPREYRNDRVRDPWRLIDVWIDGRLRTDTRIELDPGYHTITIRSGGLQFENELYFEAGRVYTLEIILRMSLSQRGW